MRGKAKLERLNHAWYGYVFFMALTNLVGAVFDAGLFAFLALPFVAVVSFISFLWALRIGTLLLRRSRLTRLAVLVLAPIGKLAELPLHERGPLLV
jgi:hypothetical protein